MRWSCCATVPWRRRGRDDHDEAESGELRVRVSRGRAGVSVGDSAPAVSRCEPATITSRCAGRTAAETLDAIRDAAVESGVGLRELTSRRADTRGRLDRGDAMSDARVIDVRFDRYRGERSGRGWAVWSLARWSALRSMGARRGWKAKLIPIALVLIAFAPAFIVLGLRALFPAVVDNLADALPFSNYQDMISIVILVFTVVITPELLCPDRRDRTLTLYFSTAVSRFEYVLGKFIAAALPLLALTLVPLVFLYLGNVVFAVHRWGTSRITWATSPASSPAAWWWPCSSPRSAWRWPH